MFTKMMKLCVIGIALAAVGLMPAQAGIIETIYSHNFSGDSGDPLNGTAPDIRPGTEEWSAHGDWKADGSIDTNEDLVNAFLPFTPVEDRIYRLSLDLNPSLPEASRSWFALGFTQSNPVSDSFIGDNVNAGPWGFLRVKRTDVSPTEGKPIVTRHGPASGGVEHHSNVDEDKWTGFVNLAIELDTRDTLWTATWSANNELLRTHTYTANPAINYVGFGSHGATGWVDNFQLAIVPEPGTVILLVSALACGLLWRRRRGKE